MTPQPRRTGTRPDGLPLAVVDDDTDILRLASHTLHDAGFRVVTLASAEEALAAIGRTGVRLVLTDVRLPGMSGLDLLAALRRKGLEAPILIMTSYASVEEAVSALHDGAADYITKPFAPELLVHRVQRVLGLQGLERENRYLHAELAATHRPGRIVAVSAAMQRVVRQVDGLARRNTRVLIVGESGTGKELLARALHFGGPRSRGPFIALNCAALPAGLAESEIFGHGRGAFTGAVADRPGKMELADRGTLFLDEIGDLPLDVQPKLLRALEEKAVERLGETRLRRVDVRIVSATHRDLQAMVRQGRFREDLYFRLAVVTVRVPPLRERPQDVAPLARFLIHHLAGPGAPEIAPDALELLAQRPWRGNVRELANLIEAALASHDGGPLTATHLVSAEASDSGWGSEGDGRTDGAVRSVIQLPPEGASLDALTREILVQALERRNWNQSAAARLLRIPRHILQYRVAKYGILPPRQD